MSHRKVSSKTGSRTTECPRAKMTYFKLHSSGGSCVSQATVIEMNGTLTDSFLLTQKIRVIHHWNKSVCSQTKCSSFFRSFTIKMPHSSSLFTNYVLLSATLLAHLFIQTHITNSLCARVYLFNDMLCHSPHYKSICLVSDLFAQQSLLHTSQCMEINKNNLFT